MPKWAQWGSLIVPAVIALVGAVLFIGALDQKVVDLQQAGTHVEKDLAEAKDKYNAELTVLQGRADILEDRERRNFAALAAFEARLDAAFQARN